MSTNKLYLLDDSAVFGTTLADLVDATANKDARTSYIVTDAAHCAFLLPVNVIGGQPMGINIPYANSNKDMYKGTETRDYTIREMEFLKKIPLDIAREAFKCGVFIEIDGMDPLPMSVEAVYDLLNFVGIRGQATECRTPALMEYAYETMRNMMPKVELNERGEAKLLPLGNSQVTVYKKRGTVPKSFEFTLSVMRDEDNPNVKKVFACRSGKYTPIPQKSLIEIIDGFQMMGKPEVLHWELNHKITEAVVGFMDIAEEFTNVFQLKEPIIPGFRLTTSDTGNSSLRVEKTVVLKRNGIEICLPALASIPEENESETEQEKEINRAYARHYGKDIPERILGLIGKANTNMYKSFKAYPKALSELAFMGEGDTTALLKEGFRAMELQKHCVIVSQELETKIVESLAKEMTPISDVLDVVYTILFASENKNLDISENQRAELRRNAMKAVFGNYVTVLQRSPGMTA